MSDSIVPESRIFRIGRECYIVYLGKELDDIRPFLRIGNARDIPDEVHDVLSTTVVTDDHVGNPLLEILIAPKFHGRYLGDTGVVATIRRFFKSFDLPTDDVTDYRKVKDGERRHMIWFYSSGNIHLRYDDQVIFDLYKREKEDRHFVRLYEEAKGEFLRNPLRYIRQDFSGQGVVLTDGNAFWYEAGELLSFSAHPGFVAKLMGDGVDPDFISASAYNISPEEMDSHDAAVYIGFVKRMRQRRKQLRVITSSPGLQRKLKLLFPERGDVPVTLDITDVSGKRKATFRDSIVSWKEEHWHLHRAGLPELTFGAESESGISIDIENGRIKFSSETETVIFSPPGGFPIEFVGHEVPDNQLSEKYVGYVLTNVKDHLSDSEVQAVTALERYLKMFRDDSRAKKASVSPLLKQTGGNARDALRRCSPTEGGPSWFFFSNIRSILEISKKRLGMEHGLTKSAEQMIEALRALLNRLPAPDHVMPFWGDLYLGDEPCLLWRASKRGFVPADIAATREANDRISSIASLNERPWHDDLDRLLSLISSLGQGGQGPLTDEQLAILSQPGKDQVKSESDKKKEPAEPGRARSSERIERQTETQESFSGVKRKKSGTEAARKSRGKGWLWILLILLLLIGGAVVWDLSGNAPWGRVLGSSGVGERNTVDDGIEPTGDAGDAVTADTTDTTDTTDVSETVSAADTGMVEESESDVQAGTAGVDVDPDVAPRTRDEVAVYLNVDGRIVITEADIHLAANDIAVLNGYMDLDYKVYTGDDPDWIYPGRTLRLPGTGDYVIRKGDTIWFLAAREVRVDVVQGMAIFDKSLAVLEDAASASSARADAADALRDIAEGSKAAELRIMAQKALSLRQL